MAFVSNDTIVAIATPPGVGGVGVVRLSGVGTKRIAQQMVGRLQPRRAQLKNFRNEQGESIDTGIAILFPGPQSFTGEDVLELQAHGGPVLLQLLVDAAIALGARLAEPGEFSFRAFFNDRIDLVQAEAIADLIASESKQAATAAYRSLSGELSQRIHTLADQLTKIRLVLEAYLDFPDEELAIDTDTMVMMPLTELELELAELATETEQAVLRQEGLTIALVGRPNVGKSSLFNRLARDADAIVTSIPGTTRDVLKERLQINGTPIWLLDTAGVMDSRNELDDAGQARTLRAIEKADRALFIIDASVGFLPEDYAIKDRLEGRLPFDIIANKCDLGQQTPGWHGSWLYVSATSNAGIDTVMKRLAILLGSQTGLDTRFAARRRHAQALAQCHQYVVRARCCADIPAELELIAENLRVAGQYLGSITGKVTTEDLLDEIFSQFCIGK